MNRAERRAAGWRGPAFTTQRNDPRPRYVRRHANAIIDLIVAGAKLTRRQRKQFARLERAAQRMGL